jgi:hypothetical protein
VRDKFIFQLTFSIFFFYSWEDGLDPIVTSYFELLAFLLVCILAFQPLQKDLKCIFIEREKFLLTILIQFHEQSLNYKLGV